MMGKAATKTTADQMQNLANATPEFLADELGDIRQQVKDLKKREGFIKTALNARLDYDDLVHGERYGGVKLLKERASLDTARIREDHDEAWIEKYTNVSQYDQIDTPKLANGG